MRTLADAQQNLGWISYLEGNLEKAEQLYNSALRISESADDNLLRARCLDALGTLSRVRGDTVNAILSKEAALTIRRESKDRPTIATSYINLGVVYFGVGKYHHALQSFSAAMNIHLERGDINGAANALVNLGASELELGLSDEAAEHLAQATEMALKSGAWYTPECYRYSAEAALLSHDSNTARRFAMEGLRLLGDDGPMELRGNLRSALGLIELHDKNFDAAAQHLEAAIEAHEVSQNRFELAVTLTRQSQLSSVCGDDDIARTQLLRAQELFKEAGNETWEERTSNALAALG